MRYNLVQRSTGRVIAQESEYSHAVELANLLAPMYGVLDVEVR
jgi:hypothetical protein